MDKGAYEKTDGLEMIHGDYCNELLKSISIESIKSNKKNIERSKRDIKILIIFGDVVVNY